MESAPAQNEKENPAPPSNNTRHHPDWREENSLTAPADRDRNARWRPKQGAPPLTEEQAQAAFKDLVDDNMLRSYPAIERRYIDPEIPSDQKITLVSFTPAKGAIPDSDGFFGFMRFRGAYQSQIECDERADFLIRNAGSYHVIQYAPTGRPIPVTSESKYSEAVNEVDVRKKIVQETSSDIAKKRRAEKQEEEEIKERHRALMEEAEEGVDADPTDRYTTMTVKKAQLIFTYNQHKAKMKEIRPILRKTQREMDEMNAESDGKYKEEARTRYMEARKKLDLSETPQNAEQNWILYIGEDPEKDHLDFDIFGEDTDVEEDEKEDEDEKGKVDIPLEPSPAEEQKHPPPAEGRESDEELRQEVQKASETEADDVTATIVAELLQQ
jgi:hypothetical protein